MEGGARFIRAFCFVLFRVCFVFYETKNGLQHKSESLFGSFILGARTPHCCVSKLRRLLGGVRSPVPSREVFGCLVFFFTSYSIRTVQ